jgi:hypothetical protein
VVGMGLGAMRRGFDGVAATLGLLGDPYQNVSRGLGGGMGAEWFGGLRGCDGISNRPRNY